jgi:hypothetical protein
VLDYRAGGWRLRDLGTRNGTTINGRACGDGWHDVVAGDQIHFGGADEAWDLVEDGRPPPAAVSESGETVLGHGDVLVLPDEEHAVLSVHADGGRWRLDDGTVVRDVDHEGTVEVDGTPWELLLPDAHHATTTPGESPWLDPDVTTVVFEYDRPEEHVRITLEQGALQRRLPERSFFFMLLLLARAREHDATVRGLSDEEAGWIDSAVFADQVKLRPKTVNLYVFRARELVARHGLVDAARIVERRPLTQQLRFGLRSVRMVAL